jgi:hypothetical protein
MLVCVDQANGNCDVAELQFFSPNPSPMPGNLTYSRDGARLALNWPSGGILDDSFLSVSMTALILGRVFKMFGGYVRPPRSAAPVSRSNVYNPKHMQFDHNHRPYKRDNLKCLELNRSGSAGSLGLGAWSFPHQSGSAGIPAAHDLNSVLTRMWDFVARANQRLYRHRA